MKSHLLLSAALVLWVGIAPVTTHALAPPPANMQPAASPKARLIVLTDVGGEPDDSESLVRLMLYANQIDIEGLVATTSIWMRDQTHPDLIRETVAAYGEVQPNLLRHEAGFPTAGSLMAKIVSGQPGYGVGAIGKGKDTAGSDLIIRALESDDPRPLWVTAWGGVNTLAQALYTIRETRSADEARRLVAKLRVYTISDQDDAGPWLRKNFPDLFYIFSPGPYANATWLGINIAVEGIDNTRISTRWLADNIQQGHGPLGEVYPDVSWGMEGDTPSFLGLIPNGLNVPERPDFGGWGGRYQLGIPSLEGLGSEVTGGIPITPETRPVWFNAVDTFAPYEFPLTGRSIKYGTKTFSDFRVTIWRWRDDFQNDFAARMDWTTKPYAEANHAPLAFLATPEQITVKSGSLFSLSAQGSHDPDGDSLSYLWLPYPEAGSLEAPLTLEGPENYVRVNFRAPVVTRPQTTHIILRVTDKGSPPLTRYRRVIVTIVP